ncbi:MAG: radical SAM protein [Hyphomicrobiales bacterium]|nr:radical SAM protein [Hyphomicrobiales bacterium]
MNGADNAPFLVALNLTRRCNLKCAHCYLDAGTLTRGDPDELTTPEAFRLLDEIAELSRETMVVLTGGEPLLRPDIMEIASHAARLDLMVVMGTNGVLLNNKRVAALQRSGVSAVGISVDSLEPKYHDSFRGAPGSWVKTMAGIDACRRAGLMFQIHFSVTDDNAHELESMIDFCRSSGAAVLNVFFLVCTGRGENFNNISLDTYEDVLRRVAAAACNETELLVRARCAPHFKRMALEMDPPLPVTLIHEYEAGGCLAGTRYCRITPVGGVSACPYIEESVGSIRDEGFAEIWRDAPMFKALREPKLEGRCGRCEYARLCGGCRARPFAKTGALMGEDFLCGYQPGGGATIEVIQSASTVPWTQEAEARLARVPGFVRRFVRKRAETHALETGAPAVTAAHLEELAKRRFGDAPPFARPAAMGDTDPLSAEKRESE